MKALGWHMEVGDHHACGDRGSRHPGNPDPWRANHSVPGHSGLTPAISIASALDAETAWEFDPSLTQAVPHLLLTL